MTAGKRGRRRVASGGWRAALVLSLVLLGGCSKANSSPRGRSAEAMPVPVRVATAVQKAMPVQVTEVGNVEPYATVAVKSQVTAAVLTVNFQEGQAVKKGDLLFTLDARPFQAALNQAEANLGRDTLEAKNAELVAGREADLLSKGFVSQEENDQARTAADAAAAAVKADQAACDDAKLQVEYCTIRSPIDARTGARLIDAGNQIKANDATMVVLNQVSPVRVGFSVREGDLSAVQQGFAAGELKVRAIIPGQEDRPEDGTVTFVNNTVDPTTGTILLKGTFQNADRRLWPGQFVNVVLTLAVQADAIVVPSQAVQLGQQGRFIYVVKPDKTVEATPVEVGREVGPETVIAKGIVPEQVVVTDGQLRLVPGAKVQVQAEGPPAREATP